MANLSQLLNKKIADHAVEVICDSARASLVRNTAILSGDDSDLRNTWEEICVQVRGGRTLFWDAYECAMRDAVLGTLLLFDRSVIENLWLHTDEGWDLIYDLRKDLETGASKKATYSIPDIPVDDNAIAREIITNYLLPMAEDYSNPRIETFLYPGSDDLYGPPDDAQYATDSDASSDPPTEVVREVEYYEDDDIDSRYFTCINRHYIFAIRSDESDPKWECINLNHTRWDAIHQRIYRNYRASRLQRNQLPPGLPPPPESIPPEAINPPPPSPPKPILCSDYPVIADYLAKCDGASLAIYVVLEEDTYESLQGDGEFHYAEAVFLDLPSAKEFRPNNSGWYRYHVRPGLVWLNGEEFGYEVPSRIFDRIYREKVLELLSEQIKTNAKPTKPTRRKSATTKEVSKTGDLF